MIVKPVLDASKEINHKAKESQFYKESKSAPINTSSASPNSVENIKCTTPQVILPSIVPIDIIQRKADWKDFNKIVTSRNIRTLYHFTDKRNIQSIKQQGALYSWFFCDTHSIAIPFPASNDLSKNLDVRKGLEDFVRLSLNPDQPMMHVVRYRGIDPYILEISPEVIYWLDTQFSNVNATANNSIIGSSLPHFQNINFYIALGTNWTTPEEKAQYQAEILVKTKIPIQFITNI